MNQSELISVLIPVYNIESYIGPCLDSVLTQSYKNLEIIVVNDGSTDHSGEICQWYCERDQRIRYVYQKNGGSVRARKAGLNYALGSYIVFVDGDDRIEGTLIERLYSWIKKQDVDFVHSNYMVRGVEQLFYRKHHLYRETQLDRSARIELIRKHLLEWRTGKEIFECNLYASIYKPDVIRSCYDMLPDTQSYGEDLLCYCHLIMRCSSMLYVPEAYYHYIDRNDSLDRKQEFLPVMGNFMSLYHHLCAVMRDYGIDEEVRGKLDAFLENRIINKLVLLNAKDRIVKEEYYLRDMNLFRNRRVILYGAGRVGRDYYRCLSASGKACLCAWADRSVEQRREIGSYAISPDEIVTIDYDIVLIAVESGNLAEVIREELVDAGVRRDSILWVEPGRRISITCGEAAHVSGSDH